MHRDSVWKKLTEDMSALISQPLVEIIGTDRVLVENHKGIAGYEKNSIGIRMAYGMLIINGCGLELVQITSQQLVVTGKIAGISLTGGDCHPAAEK